MSNQTFFCADTHFRHFNILAYQNRPFASIQEHDEVLIKNWNSVVTNNDIVYFLGDFILGDEKDAIQYLNRLNYRKIYITKGNHDHALRRVERELENGYTNKEHFSYKDLGVKREIIFLPDLCEVNIKNELIILCHYSLKTWRKSHHGSLHAFGHSHGNLPDDPYSLSMDVGVDCNNYYPFSWSQIKERMSKKLFKPIDHHGREEGGGIGLSKEDYARAERKKMYEQLKEEFKNE